MTAILVLASMFKEPSYKPFCNEQAYSTVSSPRLTEKRVISWDFIFMWLVGVYADIIDWPQARLAIYNSMTSSLL